SRTGPLLPSRERMPDQLDIFGAAAPPPAPALPEGFRHAPDVIAREVEASLLAWMQELPFREFQFHGYVGNRRTVSFGWRYDFGEERLHRTDDMPAILLPVRESAARFAGLAPKTLQQALVTEYDAGAGIGWHRDKAMFGEVVGISLRTACRFRLRRRRDSGWDRVTLTAEPRSAYLLSGPARTEWEHSIPAVEELRYSITFRNLRT
ncbi:MAG TPA: alpha-ketoglutarate-dependent dioxygenase AlkB, partial [Gemmatimonadaceae bacterium]|nr:alpha-ketoglutarate-dependent dioxygenase AlkB [Gemmatimonadaceae bacterium]